MFDTLAVAQQLAAGGVARAQAVVIAGAIRQAVDQGEHVASDQFKAGLAEVRAEIAEVRAEISGLDTRLSTQIADVRTEVSALDTRLSTDRRLDRIEPRPRIDAAYLLAAAVTGTAVGRTRPRARRRLRPAVFGDAAPLPCPRYLGHR